MNPNLEEQCGCRETPCVCEVKPEHIRRFKRACKTLHQVLRDVQEYLPTAECYLANDTLNLMTGPGHVGPSAEARQDRVVTSVTLPNFDGGDW